MEDYVLLAGTIGLLLALALVMYVTRNVDWFAIGLPPQGRHLYQKQATTRPEKTGESGLLSSRHSRESGNPALRPWIPLSG